MKTELKKETAIFSSEFLILSKAHVFFKEKIMIKNLHNKENNYGMSYKCLYIYIYIYTHTHTHNIEI